MCNLDIHSINKCGAICGVCLQFCPPRPTRPGTNSVSVCGVWQVSVGWFGKELGHKRTMQGLLLGEGTLLRGETGSGASSVMANMISQS